MTSSRQQFVSVRPSMRAYAGVGNWGRNQNLVEYRSNVKLGPTANVVVIVLLIALLGVLYLTQLSKTGSYSYEQNKINQRKSDLVAEQDNLKVENAITGEYQEQHGGESDDGTDYDRLRQLTVYNLAG